MNLLLVKTIFVTQSKIFVELDCNTLNWLIQSQVLMTLNLILIITFESKAVFNDISRLLFQFIWDILYSSLVYTSLPIFLELYYPVYKIKLCIFIICAYCRVIVYQYIYIYIY